jgi:dTMP kinase
MRPAAPGFFVTFEGVEGAGKSTQIRLLADALRARSVPVLLSREPGGSPLSEAIRALLLDPAHAGMEPMAELHLILAARAEHVARVVRPALDRGEVVLLDRFSDATRAYQGGGRGIDDRLIESLLPAASLGLVPDVTYLIDLAPAEGLSRRDAAGRDRLEGEKQEFHQRVRDAYLEIARREPGRIVLLNGAEAADVLHEKVLADVLERGRKLPGSIAGML